MERVIPQESNNWLSQGIKVSQLLYTVVGLIAVIGGSFVNNLTERAIMQKDLEHHQEIINQMKEDQKMMGTTLTKIDDKTNQIMIILQNKEDRK